MAKEIKTQIEINASSKKVWEVLTSFDEYPKWNPFIKSIKGEVKVGNTIIARIEPPGVSGMTFKPRVLAFEPHKELCWLGHFLIPGLFDGEHKFELVEKTRDKTLLVQREKFKGILIPLFSNMLDNNTVKGFDQMNQELKRIAEKV